MAAMARGDLAGEFEIRGQHQGHGQRVSLAGAAGLEPAKDRKRRKRQPGKVDAPPGSPSLATAIMDKAENPSGAPPAPGSGVLLPGQSLDQAPKGRRQKGGDASAPAPIDASKLERPKMGFEAIMEEALLGVGGWNINDKGKRAKSGPHRGMTEGEIFLKEREKYRNLPDDQRLEAERKATGEDVRSQREVKRQQEYDRAITGQAPAPADANGTEEGDSADSGPKPAPPSWEGKNAVQRFRATAQSQMRQVSPSTSGALTAAGLPLVTRGPQRAQSTAANSQSRPVLMPQTSPMVGSQAPKMADSSNITRNVSGQATKLTRQIADARKATETSAKDAEQKRKADYEATKKQAVAETARRGAVLRTANPMPKPPVAPGPLQQMVPGAVLRYGKAANKFADDSNAALARRRGENPDLKALKEI